MVGIFDVYALHEAGLEIVGRDQRLESTAELKIWFVQSPHLTQIKDSPNRSHPHKAAQ
jgi:hypothetical protein